MDRTPLPLAEDGNGARLRTLVYDEADALMMAHAMLIAANTAMMCDGPVAMRRLQFYRRQFEAAAPPAAKLLREETDLCEIAIAMSEHPKWQIQRKFARRWSTEARTCRFVLRSDPGEA